MKKDIFISYSRKDNKIVYDFIERLEQLEYTIWVDRTGIATGDRFLHKIYQAINEAAVFLFFSSKSSNESEWVSKEIQHALSINIPIIPIKLDETLYHQDVRAALDEMDFASFPDLDISNETSIKRVLAAISNRVWGEYSNDNTEDIIEKAESFIPSNAELGFKLMKIAAQRENALAQYRLGDFYTYGIGCKKDLSQAIHWYAQSSEQHFYLAQVELGRFLLQGIGERKDEQRAFALFSEAASQKYDEAYIELGKCYENGIGTTCNLKKAIDCYHAIAISNSPFKKEGQYLCAAALRKDAEINERVMGSLPAYCLKLFYLAAQQGHAAAQYTLGALIERGMEVEFTQSEIDEGFEFYEWLVSSGSPGKVSYTNMTTFVYLVKPDQAIANSWYAKAARNGNLEAQMKLGDYYYWIAPDLKLAFSFYREAAKQNSSRAYYLLGEFFRLGIGGQSRNDERANNYYQKAADLGNSQAAARLALWYYKDERKRNDKRHEISRKYAEKGLEGNNRLAQYIMGLIYSDGLLNNMIRAKYYFELSAYQDYSPAQYELACNIQREDFNSPEAIKWFEKSASLGNVQAMRSLHYILKKKDPQKALQYLEQAVSVGDVESSYKLSTMLFRGDDVQKDEKRAVELLLLSAKTYMPALKELADRYAKGDGVERDIEQSNHMYNEYYDWMIKNNPSFDYSLEMLVLSIDYYLGSNGYLCDEMTADYWCNRAFEICLDWQDKIVCMGFAYEEGGILPYNTQKRDYWFNRALTINPDFSKEIAKIYEVGEVKIDEDNQFFIKPDQEKAFYYLAKYIGGNYVRALEQCLRQDCADVAFWISFAASFMIPIKPSIEEVTKCVSLTEKLAVAYAKSKSLDYLSNSKGDIEQIISNAMSLIHRADTNSFPASDMGACLLLMAHAYQVIKNVEMASNHYESAIDVLEHCHSDNYKHSTNLTYGYTNLAYILVQCNI